MTSAPHLGFERAYERRVLLAVELLDPVSMTRVSDGFSMIAHGLKHRPIISRSGSFVWLEEKDALVKRITVDPGSQPYSKIELTDVRLPLTTITLQPTANYQFPTGVTGLRGTLIESKTGDETPVTNAGVQLEWRDHDKIWHVAPEQTRTDEQSGNFVSFLRLSPVDGLKLKAGRRFLEIRLRVGRDGSTKRSGRFALPHGTVVEPSIKKKRKFAWDELNT